MTVVHAPLDPFPSGWFCVAASSELPPGKVLRRQLGGQDVVVFRGRDDRRVHVVDPYCPHLGAHMGYGSTVEGDAIRCPFHGLEFDGGGRCVHAPGGVKTTKRMTLGTWPVEEKNGFVFVYFDRDRRHPDWQVPELDQKGWSRPRHTRLRLKTHPQETSENSVDLGHLSVVHGYEEVRYFSDEFEIDGPHLHAHYAMRRGHPLLPERFASLIRVKADFHVHVWGLGYSLVEAHMPELGMKVRIFVLSTHTDGDFVNLTLGTSVYVGTSQFKLTQLFRYLFGAIASPIALYGLRHDVLQDKHIWENKINVSPPALIASDGPIGPYRRYAKQFYPSSLRQQHLRVVDRTA